jgi:hypothetical protein
VIIKHRKIQSLLPVWAEFCGYSLIFESATGAPADRPATFADDPEALAYFAAITGAINKTGAVDLMNSMLLCLLPPESYHVTAVDLFNQGSVTPPDVKIDAAMAELIADARDGARGAPPLLQELGLRAGVNQRYALRLRFAALDLMANRAMALRLVPADERSATTFALMQAWRQGLQRKIEERTGIEATPFSPHLTLGYFANPRLVSEGEDVTEKLAQNLARALDGLSLPLPAIALYAFSSMANFRRIDAEREFAV